MKKIFVTVAEFLENGGEIVNQRQLYKRDHTDVPMKTLGWYVCISEHEGMITVGNIDKSFVYYSNQAWIEIPCTPHYI